MKKLVLGLLIAGASVSSSFAYDVYFSVKDFDWKETENGMQMVHETGKLIGLGIGWEGRFFGILDTKNKMEFYGKSVDYKGHAVNTLTGDLYPANTNTTYFGINPEIALGKKFKLNQDIAVMPYIGIGYDMWFRNLGDGTHIDEYGNTQPFSGYTELYFIGYSPIGIQAKTQYKGIDLSVYGQYNYNFFIREKVDKFGNTTLKPKRGNAYRLGVKAGYKMFFAEAFYDYLHLKKSDVETAIDDNGNVYNVFQPDSKRKMMGINIGMRF